MLCDNCIKALASTCTAEAQQVFNTLAITGKMSMTQIQKETGLSYAITSRSINELENKLLINHRVKGRAKEYWLTKFGGRLVLLSQAKGSKRVKNNKKEVR